MTMFRNWWRTLRNNLWKDQRKNSIFYQLEIVHPSMSAVVSMDRHMAQSILRSLDESDSVNVTVSSREVSLTLHLEVTPRMYSRK